MVSHYPAKFGGHRHCDSGDIIVLVCHVISQEYVIKRSRDLVVVARQGKSPSDQVSGPRHSGSGDIMVLVVM